MSSQDEGRFFLGKILFDEEIAFEGVSKCPHCQRALWNVPRANRKQGKPEPTRKGKPRGRTMTPSHLSSTSH